MQKRSELTSKALKLAAGVIGAYVAHRVSASPCSTAAGIEQSKLVFSKEECDRHKRFYTHSFKEAEEFEC